jgi:hypothetical protein
MCESKCCCCAYQTPPWWVTMGFVPYSAYSGQRPPSVQVPAPPIGLPGTGTVTQPTQPSGGQSSGGGLLQTVGNVIGDVLNPLGALTHLL